MSKLKNKIMSTKYDEQLHNVQTSAVVVMMICITSFFLVKKFLHSFLWLLILIFLIALLISFSIGMIWFLRDFIPYREAGLRQFYEKHPEYSSKNNVQDKSKETDKVED